MKVLKSNFFNGSNGQANKVNVHFENGQQASITLNTQDAYSYAHTNTISLDDIIRRYTSVVNGIIYQNAKSESLTIRVGKKTILKN